MQNKIFHTLVFKSLAAFLLLFVVLFGLLVIPQLRGLPILLIGFFLSLGLVLYFLLNLTRAISRISGQLDQMNASDFAIKSYKTNSLELDQLSEKIAQLGNTLSTAHNDLENQHNQLTGILTYMTDGVIATDRAGRIVMINSAAQFLLSTDEQKALTSDLTTFLKIDKLYGFRDLLENNPEIVIDSTTSHGESVRIKANFSNFRRESGYISGIVAVLHDFTIQEKLDREHQLFVSNVSHELRTPLTTVKSYLDTLNDGALRDYSTARSFVTILLDETDHMIHMVSDLLELSRIDLNTSKLQKELVNIVDFLSHETKRFTQILKNSYRVKPIRIIPVLPKYPVWMEVDISKMGQVIDNLLTNAIKYSPDGGRIQLEMEVLPAYVQITITDEGIGIPSKDINRIFDRFYRVDSARTHSEGGTGLGLALVHDIVKLHEGYIQVRSQVDRGSEFTIALPYSPMAFDDTDWKD